MKSGMILGIAGVFSAFVLSSCSGQVVMKPKTTTQSLKQVGSPGPLPSSADAFCHASFRSSASFCLQTASSPLCVRCKVIAGSDDSYPAPNSPYPFTAADRFCTKSVPQNQMSCSSLSFTGASGVPLVYPAVLSAPAQSWLLLTNGQSASIGRVCIYQRTASDGTPPCSAISWGTALDVSLPVAQVPTATPVATPTRTPVAAPTPTRTPAPNPTPTRTPQPVRTPIIILPPCDAPSGGGQSDTEPHEPPC